MSTWTRTTDTTWTNEHGQKIEFTGVRFRVTDATGALVASSATPRDARMLADRARQRAARHAARQQPLPRIPRYGVVID